MQDIKKIINKNKNVVVLGSLTQDLFVYANGNSVITQSDEHETKEFYALPHGGKLTANYAERHLGGGGANVGVSFQRLGFSSYVFGAIGDDEIGEYIEKKLKKEGVNIENIEVLKNTESGFSVILNSYKGERTVIFTSQANKNFLNIAQKNIEDIQPKALYLCHISSRNNEKSRILSEVEEYVKKHDVFFAWNPGRESLDDGVKANSFLLQYCNILFLNKEEAEFLTGEYAQTLHETEHIAQKILSTGLKILVITDGKKGVKVYTKQDSFFHKSLDDEAETPVDTLGAGDSFGSAFTASILNGKTLEEASYYARMNAQSVVSHRGAQDGLLYERTVYKNI